MMQGTCSVEKREDASTTYVLRSYYLPAALVLPTCCVRTTCLRRYLPSACGVSTSCELPARRAQTRRTNSSIHTDSDLADFILVADLQRRGCLSAFSKLAQLLDCEGRLRLHTAKAQVQ